MTSCAASRRGVDSAVRSARKRRIARTQKRSGVRSISQSACWLAHAVKNQDTTMEAKNTSINQAGVMHNCLYMMSLAMDRIVRESEYIMSKHSELFVKEKKQQFNRYAKTIRDAIFQQDKLTQDIWDMEARNDYRNVDFWLEQGNELARLILLFADRSSDQNNVDKVFSLLRSLPGEGIVDEELLKLFYLK